ncbi:hypothetical protein V6N13_129677 [Hibiscus sabdariffa]|uniref:F-box domain-containing protein n=1 Tax=Hibiscus sabdariffa TaxID=183260 RepID=A0ABR2SLW3_9ROSI
MSGTDCRTNRSENYKERPNSRRLQQEKHALNWSDMPYDIVECILGHLCWRDRIRMRAVCKAWSVPSRHIPAIDKLPWVLKDFSYRLFDPFTGGYVRGKGGRRFIVEKLFGRSDGPLDAVPLASEYGWILFRNDLKHDSKVEPPPPPMLFLYSPFTTEIIKLPELKEVASFSLNATSPKCVIFLLGLDSSGHKINVSLCSPGDHSWRTFEFNSGIGPGEASCARGVVYANGVFYCLFLQGQLGVFNVELEEWSILSTTIFFRRFDFSEMRWVYQSNLNNHALFIGCFSFAVPTVEETSELANTIVSLDKFFEAVSCYGGTRESELHHKCLEATERAITWIQLPLGGIWRANDLVNAI